VTLIAETDERRQLLARIKAKRASVRAFVRQLEPLGDRETNVSIICSAVAAVLTAGPAIGGTSFTGAIQGAFALHDDAPVWRLLCLTAMAVSVVAAISTNLYKSHDVAGRLSKAEACNAGLEGLETLVEFGQIQLGDALKLYQQYVAGVPFIPGEK
jgi:hypothetical protein